MHRPTFHNAIGGQNQGGNLLVAKSTKVSARDLSGQLALKTRQPKPTPLYTEESQVREDDLLRREGYRNKLEEREREHQIKKAREKSLHGPLEALVSETSISLINKVPAALLPDQEENPFPEDSDDEGPFRSRTTQQPSSSSRSRAQSDSESDSDDDDDDEEEALMRELAKIKRDREDEERRKAEELAQQEAVEERARVLKANPLLLTDSSSTDRTGLKRRWDDDVVFRNQVKDAPKPKKRFINDTVRSEFHRKFLTKYIQ